MEINILKWMSEENEYTKLKNENDTHNSIRVHHVKGLEEYQCGMDTTVYDSDGSSHTVEHSGVAKHPGDLGMKWIADRIIDVVRE